MPHFIIDCSKELLNQHSEDTILEQVHTAAVQSGLFKPGDIKVRVNPFSNYLVGGTNPQFIHVFAHIMQGRSVEQRRQLSQAVVKVLSSLFPEVEAIAMNVYEFEKNTYWNRAMQAATH